MTLKKVFLTIVSTLVMVIPVKVIHMLLDVSYTSRIVDIVVMLGCGGLMLIIYYFVSSYFNLPQQILHIRKVSPKAILKRFRA